MKRKDDGKAPPDLPDPSRMTREELEAEVFGGRLAYESIVQEVRLLRRQKQELKDSIADRNRQIDHLIKKLYGGKNIIT